MFPWVIESFLHVCDWFGLCAEYFHQNNSFIYRYPRTIFIVHILNAVVVSITMCYLVFIRLFESNPVGFANECSKFVCLGLVYCLVIIEAAPNRSRKREFWQLYEHIRTISPPNIKRNITQRRFSIKCILFSSLFIFQAVATSKPLWSQSPRYMEILLFQLCDFLLFTVQQLQIFFYVFCTNLLSDELNAFNQNLEEVLKDLKLNRKSSLLHCKLTATCHHYYLVQMMAQYLNEIFGWSHLMAILNCFLGFVACFNFIYECQLADDIGKTLKLLIIVLPNISLYFILL